MALLVGRGLGEDASQLGFPRMGRLTVDFALSAHRLFLHHRYSRPIHLHIQNAHRLPDDHRQIQLDGPLDLPLFALRDVASYGLCRTFHRFGGDFQIETACLAPTTENDAQELVYFARNFLAAPD
jgi:hypothetical protein